MKLRLLFIILIVLSAAADMAGQPHNSKADGDWWIQSYGEIKAETNPAVTKATEVLDKLWDAMQPTDFPLPRLIVIPSSADKWLDSWALTLSDGSIILIESVLDLVFNSSGVDDAQGRSRLAFILAHEMAHLHHQDHQRLGIALLFQTLTNEHQVAEARAAELKADKVGLFTMTMAGYQPQMVLQSANTSFFLEYIQKVRKKIRSIGKKTALEIHPQAAQRAEELRHRMSVFSGEIGLFTAAVSDYQNSDYETAVSKFKTFSVSFPSREVFNNLGLSYFQLAKKRVAGCPEERFTLQLASYLEKKTLAEKLRPEKIAVLVEEKEAQVCQADEQYRYLQKMAGISFKLAKTKDKGYWPARLNHTSWMIHQGEYKQAKVEIEELMTTDDRKPYALNNRAIVEYLENTAVNKQNSIRLLKSIPESSPVFLLAQQNLATISNKKEALQSTTLDAKSEVSADILKNIKD